MGWIEEVSVVVLDRVEIIVVEYDGKQLVEGSVVFSFLENWSFAASYYIVREIRVGAGDVVT
jgi:hypothetical protein